jgi:hypothetical protein
MTTYNENTRTSIYKHNGMTAIRVERLTENLQWVTISFTLKN